MSGKKIICMWSSPRNISTALMYSFAQRSDTRVMDEPLYGHYLKVSGAEHPGRNEIIESMETDGRKVLVEIMNGDSEGKILFLKHMTHHYVELESDYLENFTNIFLIRDPVRIIASFAKVIPDVTMTDIGVKKQFELFSELSQSGAVPVVIDSGEILKDPKKTLAELCSKLGLPFDEKMLRWKPGPKPEDGIWAKYWYSNVHQTTGFERTDSTASELPDELLPLLDECKIYYQSLFEHSIKA